MREVSACDFCGGEAAGTFEVLPPEVDGGRRMVLCPGCRDTLGTVLEPLLAATDDAPPAATAVGSGASDDAEPASAGDDGGVESTEGDAESDDDDAESDDGADTDDAVDTNGADGEDVPAGDDEAGDGSTSTTAADAAAAPPHGYRKVVRFLQNREFPIDRDHAVSMVSDAYALEPRAVEAAIDHAVEEGRFSESGGELTVA